MAKRNNVAVVETNETVTEEQAVAAVLDFISKAKEKVEGMKLTTKSAKIRAFNAEGLTRSQIAHLMGIRYQHVRNVLIAPVKKAEEKAVEAANEAVAA
jgi:hypothetical protein